MKNSPKNNLYDYIEDIKIPIWVIDNEGRLISANKIFYYFFGSNEFGNLTIGQKLPDVFFKYINIKFEDLKHNFTNHSEHKKFETEISSENNSIFFEITVFPIIKNQEVEELVFVGNNITDRKHSITILNKAKTQLQALIDNIPSLIWLKDNNGNYIVANKNFCNFFELTSHLFINGNIQISADYKTFFEYISNDSDIIETGKRISDEKPFTIKNETKWFEIHKTPIFNERHEFVGSTGMASDITSRKTIENILLESEEKFRQFAENTSDSFILSSQKEILYINPSFEKIFGRKAEESYIHYHIPEEWIYPEDRKKIITFFKSEEYKQNGRFNGQYRIIKPDGSIAWIWERSFPVRNERGEVIRYISVASDITIQKQLECNLLVNQAQMQAILYNIPHLAWLKDISGKYILINDAFAKFYNRTKEEIIGKSDSEICSPDLAEIHSYNDYLVIKTKKQQQFDEFVETNEGTKYTETIKTPILDSEDNVIGITGISRDVTYYKKIEQQLRANEDRIKALLLHSTDSITVVDEEGRVIFDSSFFHKIAGIDNEEAKGHLFTEYVHSSDEGIVLYAIDKVLKEPSSQQIANYCCIKPNGEIVYFESFFTNHINNPLIKGIVINSRDITDKIISEKKEQVYQERVSFLENTALDFLSMRSSDEIYSYIGKKIQELVPSSVVIFCSYDEITDSLIIKNLSGISKFDGIVRDLIGKDPINHKMPLTPAIKRKLFWTSNKLHEISGGLYNITSRQVDYMICKSLEKLITLNKAYGMGIVRSENLLGSIVILTRYENYIDDPRIIETFIYQASIALLRRKLEKELIIAKEKAEESDKLKTAFLANMSHEIRTPINGIIGFTQLLESYFDDVEKRTEFIEIIKQNANILLNLIDDIIDVSRIQEGQVRLKKTIVNVNLLLKDIFSPYMAMVTHGKNINIKIETALPDEDAIVLADPLRLKQILNNLLSNAFKFTERGTITVGYTVDNNMIIFYVSDTGIGIPEDKIDTIFQRFSQADLSFTRRFGGSGLGLTICKGLVELMGGNIWVESTLGLGSKFYFSIPGLCCELGEISNLLRLSKNSIYN